MLSTREWKRLVCEIVLISGRMTDLQLAAAVASATAVREAEHRAANRNTEWPDAFGMVTWLRTGSPAYLVRGDADLLDVSDEGCACVASDEKASPRAREVARERLEAFYTRVGPLIAALAQLPASACADFNHSTPIVHTRELAPGLSDADELRFANWSRGLVQFARPGELLARPGVRVPGRVEAALREPRGWGGAADPGDPDYREPARQLPRATELVEDRTAGNAAAHMIRAVMVDADTTTPDVIARVIEYFGDVEKDGDGVVVAVGALRRRIGRSSFEQGLKRVRKELGIEHPKGRRPRSRPGGVHPSSTRRR
ncbi:MAG TPA: hypothetical protein VG755_20610 [Nannocystaceae bacterium]|nr:hypothetical protein [Nannocystaceae bacterium]